MGQCGCGDFDSVRWAVRIGGLILACSEYDGCNNGCAAPLGFTLHLMTEESAKQWGIEPTGTWTPDRLCELAEKIDAAELAWQMGPEDGRRRVDVIYDALTEALGGK